jgi:tellurite methyltransferase
MTRDGTTAEAEYWNQRHARRAREGPAGRAGDLLTEHADLIPQSGKALDAAAGLGANGLYLARHGLSVIAVDFAHTGLRIAIRAARNDGLDLQAVVCDLGRFYLPARYFSIIVNMMYLNRGAIPLYLQALKPGGLLFFECLLEQGEGNRLHYLRPEEIDTLFDGFQVEFEGGRLFHSGEGSVMRQTYQRIARRPMDG